MSGGFIFTEEHSVGRKVTSIQLRRHERIPDAIFYRSDIEKQYITGFITVLSRDSRSGMIFMY